VAFFVIVFAGCYYQL
jgi:hypothetical protein